MLGSGSCGIGAAFGTFSCSLVSLRFRKGNPRDAGFSEASTILVSSPIFRPAIGFSTPLSALPGFSCAFFFRAAANACNFDIFGGPSDDEPPRRPPRGYKGATRTDCRWAGTLNHGVSLKKSANEKGLEHGTPGDPSQQKRNSQSANICKQAKEQTHLEKPGPCPRSHSPKHIN